MINQMNFSDATPELTAAVTRGVVTFEHQYFSGWFQGAWIDGDGNRIASTVSAYSSPHRALTAAAEAFNALRYPAP